MHVVKNGYVGGAILLLPFSRKLRAHVEYEKFLARIMVDNETTREFKRKTDAHKDAIYKLRYNSDIADRLTAAGRNKKGKNDGN